ncbi:PREDICTED: uncharacterized protein LOC104715431 [Camelina sativa]|uniref:Uncharacterized protein LOC104715431 n=1 Tax=Camelina sativa TaxID=90675 RepID=A0ABM1QGA1_CAMSA|nr:PREDICTED: uncharacterized protein LOC104715431 [Camelina sativa]
MTRLLLDLITLEKQVGNSRGKSLSEKGKENVLTEFKKEFPLTLNWNKIKNRLDTLKRQYELYPSKLRSHPLRFIPLLHVVFRDETVVVEESWQPRHGVNRHAPLVDVSETERTNKEDEREDMMHENEPHHMETEDPDWMSQIPRENSANPNSEAEPSFASKETSSMHTQEKISQNRKRKQNPVDSTLDRIATTMEDRNDILEQMTNAKSKS